MRKDEELAINPGSQSETVNITIIGKCCCSVFNLFLIQQESPIHTARENRPPSDQIALADEVKEPSMKNSFEVSVEAK